MKTIIARFQIGMYEKVKKFAEENGLTFMGALRFIINQFFKPQK